MSEFLNAVIGGLGQGAVYAMLALGFVMIFKASGVISFAQPAFMLCGAVAVSYLVDSMPFFIAVPVAVLLVAIVALSVERAVVRPMVGKPVFIIAIITIGVDIVVRVIAGAFIGVDLRSIGDPWGTQTLSLGTLVIEHRHLAMLLTGAVVVAGLFAFFKYTPVGLAMRAVALDQEATMAQGVNVGTIFALSWAMAGGLAAVAGMYAATGGSSFDANLWIIALKALPVIIIGGLDSFGGAVVGGLLVGVVESVVATYEHDFPASVANVVGHNFASVTPYVLMLIVLLVRPYGLFGTKEVIRV